MAKKAATKSAKPLIDELFGEAPAKKTRARKTAKRRRTAKAAPAAEEEQPKPVRSGTPKISKVLGGVSIPYYPLELATKQLGAKTPAVLEWYEKNHPEAHKALVAYYENQ